MSNKNKDAERKAEAVFNQQQQIVNAQIAEQESRLQAAIETQKQLQLQGTINKETLGLINEGLKDAIRGVPSAGLSAFLKDIDIRNEEIIRRNLGPGGQTSSPGIELLKSADLQQAQMIEQSKQGNINSFVNAATGLGGIEDARMARILQSVNNPLVGEQVLGQSLANLGALSAYNAPKDTFGRDIGSAAVSLLASKPNAFQNLKGNLQGINAFLRGKGVPYVPFI